MAQRQTHKAQHHLKTTSPARDIEQSSFEASSQSASSGEPSSRIASDTTANQDEMTGNPQPSGRFSLERYRQITIGLAFVYFIWLVFLAWVAFKVLTA